MTKTQNRSMANPKNGSTDTDAVTGYLHPGYAQSLTEFGVPRELRCCKGWVLEQNISISTDCDATGCYPLFTCQDWSQLHKDLSEMNRKWVTLSMVTDPFGDYDLNYLKKCFNKVAIPFKEHFVINLSYSPSKYVSSHHRRYARKALENLQVEFCEEPTQFLDDWVVLYTTLIERHNIEGMRAFSRSAFSKQFDVPGIVAFRANYQATTVGMLLWYVQGEVGYYHLGAYSPLGYKLRASFALFWSAVKHFAAVGLKRLSLGAGAGTSSKQRDGLTRFKQGWSTGTRTAYFCGHIFNQSRYEEILKQKGTPPTDYFPAYRLGEFG